MTSNKKSKNDIEEVVYKMKMGIGDTNLASVMQYGPQSTRKSRTVYGVSEQEYEDSNGIPLQCYDRGSGNNPSVSLAVRGVEHNYAWGVH